MWIVTITIKFMEFIMISVGIDVSKGKSTVCILKPYGEVISSPFEVRHTESELSSLVDMILRLDGDVCVVMEATGIYHLPILLYLKEKGIFITEEVYSELKLLGRQYRYYMELHVKSLQELTHLLDYVMSLE